MLGTSTKKNPNAMHCIHITPAHASIVHQIQLLTFTRKISIYILHFYIKLTRRDAVLNTITRMRAWPGSFRLRFYIENGFVSHLTSFEFTNVFFSIGLQGDRKAGKLSMSIADLEAYNG